MPGLVRVHDKDTVGPASGYDVMMDDLVSLGKEARHAKIERSPHLEALVQSIKDEWKGPSRRLRIFTPFP